MPALATVLVAIKHFAAGQTNTFKSIAIQMPFLIEYPMPRYFDRMNEEIRLGFTDEVQQFASQYKIMRNIPFTSLTLPLVSSFIFLNMS